MIVIGLTGGIATGKSTLAAFASEDNIPVFNADDVVRDLLTETDTGRRIQQLFPHLVHEAGLDRNALAQHVFANPDALLKLEQLLHPLVRQKEIDFIEAYRAQGARVVLLEIPLLFESGAESLCDVTITTSLSRLQQIKRALSRPGMTLSRLRATFRRQMKNSERRKRADYVVHTGVNKSRMREAWTRIMKEIEWKFGKAHA